MTCGDFDRLLDALLDGRSATGEWSQAQTHMSGCPGCRQLFDALGGHARSHTLDDAGHALLTEAILARTSGSPCGAARDRLCDFVDGALPALDCSLVEAHLTRCRACSALAGALARSAAVLPSFVEIEPPVSLANGVLAATSRLPVGPAITDRMADWFARAAMRPRFSVAIAYVATLLIALFLGDPVDAVRRTIGRSAVYVEPVVVAVGEQVGAGMSRAHRLGEETITAVGSLTRRPDDASKGWDAGVSAVGQWMVSNLVAPLAAVIERVSQWLREAMDALVRLVRPEPRERAPNSSDARPVAAPTKPLCPPMRLSS
jgi:predicted anti-sigma-YlaC factor YlaD